MLDGACFEAPGARGGGRKGRHDIMCNNSLYNTVRSYLGERNHRINEREALFVIMHGLR